MLNRKTSWIGVDWGTTNLRAYALDASDSVIDEKSSAKGMASLSAGEFEPALIELIDPWLTTGEVTPVIACGMVGARQGWKEAAYRSVPCTPLSVNNLTHVNATDVRIRIEILPGLCQKNPPDVMRGEETQIAGLLAQLPQFSGTVCLPGTHSKWVRLEEGRITGFRTFMTGELFSVLSTRSVLRHSVDNGECNLLEESTFLQAGLQAVDKPETVAIELFGIRAASLLDGTDQANGAARLSGMLIGQEIAAARDYWQSRAVHLIGTSPVAGYYQTVLASLGVRASIMEAREATLAGLKLAARKLLTERTQDH